MMPLRAYAQEPSEKALINPPMSVGILDEPMPEFMLNFATYGAAEMLMPMSMIKRGAALDAEGNFKSCTQETADYVREQLIRHGICDTEKIHLYQMNTATLRSTLFPGMWVTRQAIFIDEKFFYMLPKGEMRELFCSYIATLLEHSFYVKEKTASVGVSLISNQLATKLIPYITQATAAGLACTGLSAAAQVIDAYTPSVITSGASTIAYYILLGYVMSKVTPVVAKPADAFIEHMITTIDRKVAQIHGHVLVQDLLQRFVQRLSPFDARRIKLQERIAALAKA